MEQLAQLKQEVDELKKWKAEHERQQIKFPLDVTSREVVNKDLLVATGEVVEPTGLLTADTALEVTINDQTFWLLASETS